MVDYHISLCFTNELGRFDLYNWNDGVQKGLEAYAALRHKWDGAHAFAHVQIAGGGSATILSLTPPAVEGNLLHEPALIAMHNAGRYCDRAIHISM